MRYVSIPMKGMESPTDEQVSTALALMNDSAAGPVFVHCKRGADRTGAVVACYRIGHDHWDAAKSLSEARSLGMSWYQLALQRYVNNYDGSLRLKGTVSLASN
jgi:protein-tyrosine phosphatase